MSGPEVELSVVMPCLNEADTLGVCIEKAWRGAEAAGIRAEIVVADNGSQDGSRKIARDGGARVVEVAERGYGHALIAGIRAARGPFVIMGDADDSYDFGEIPKFVASLRDGNELVQGCRLPAGGGRVRPGAMPFLHRWLGNPLLSRMVRRMFGAPVHDVYCGMRGFTRDLFDRLDLRCTGMEFATEMIIKASLTGARCAEVPITLHPDGRRAHAPHLKTFRDGWRTLRFFLMSSPRWLFLVPGLLLIGLGILGYGLVYPEVEVFGARPDAHTLLVASLAILLGYQSILFSVYAKTFAAMEGLLPRDERLDRFFEIFDLEKGLVAGGLALVVGIGFLIWATALWRSREFGAMDYASTMRWVIPGVTLTALGFQTVLSSFFVSLLGMGRR